MLYRVVQRRQPGARGAERRRPGCWPISSPRRRSWSPHGAEAITTNCGFLSLFQRELAAHVRVPVATSALLQVPWVQATLPPGKRVGVITVSAQSLTPRHLEAAGVPPDTPFVGTEDGREFFRVLILGEKQDMDVGLAAAGHPGRRPARWSRGTPISAPSCWSAPTCRPMRTRCARCSGCRCYDIYSLITWLHAGLRPRDFGPLVGQGLCP